MIISQERFWRMLVFCVVHVGRKEKRLELEIGLLWRKVVCSIGQASDALMLLYGRRETKVASMSYGRRKTPPFSQFIATFGFQEQHKLST